MANISGTNGNDTLSGSNSTDKINGKGGNDYIAGKSGNDVLCGSAGDDTLIGDAGNDTLVDSIGNNVLRGSAGNDTLNAYYSSGNNILSGDPGNDTLNINYSKGKNTVSGGTGNDSFYAYQIQGTNTLNGENGKDSFYLSAPKTAPSFLATQTVDGGKDYDYLYVDYRNATEKITSTFDTITNQGLITASTNQVSYKNIEQLNIFGTAYDDYIVGSNGNDTIFSGKGYDYLSVDYSTASYSSITKTIDGGADDDYLSLHYTNATGRITSTYNAATNQGSIMAGTNRVNYKNIERLEIRGTTYDDYIVGTNGNDFLFGGSSGIDVMYGNDTIFGGAGYDNLNVDYSTSDNILNGGADDDNLSANSSTGDNLLVGDDGNDTLSASGYHSDYDGFTSATSGNNILKGGAGDDYLSADYSTSDNLLDGGDGNDSLSVSSGADYYGFATSGNNILKGGAGDDYLSASFSTGDNLLDGGDGNDKLSISGYYDYSGKYDGGFGNNMLNGGSGDDSLSVILYTAPSSLAIQTVNGGTGDDLLSISYIDPTGGEGITSTFNATTNIGSITAGTNLINYRNIERLVISGTAYNDNIIGSNGNDSFDGGSNGNDTVDGGAGDDLLSFDNYRATEGVTSTFDTTTNQGSIRTGAYLVSYKNIEQLAISGTAYDDNIVGSNGNDSFDGGIDTNGNDTIDGGAGNDLLSFYNYNGIQGISSSFDTTTNQGSIRAGTYLASYKNIEQLNILGTAYDDVIVGSNGNDSLSGGGSGNDTIDGGVGNDNVIADYSNGSNLLDGGDGNDNLSASGSFLEYRGDLYFDPISGNNTLTGGAGDDNLVADYSAGDNLLDGGDGNDYLFASGNDLYTEYGVYSASGNNTLNGGAGDDKLIVDYSSGDNLLDGGDGNDYLSASGASGNNILKGGLGNDILTGGKGNDTLYGGDGTDTFAFNSYNQGIARLYDFNASNELIQISSVDFGGGLSTPSLSASQFTLGASATTNDQRFIYDFATGALYFDQDGSADAFTQVQFAQISAGVSLTENNFMVV